MLSVIKFETKEVVYTAKGAQVIQAKSKITGKIIKRFIGQQIHDKIIAAARNVKYSVAKTELQAKIFKDQLKTYFKSFGFAVACVSTDGNHRLTLNTIVGMA